MLAARKIAMLEALGVTVYRRTRRVPQPSRLPKDQGLVASSAAKPVAPKLPDSTSAVAKPPQAVNVLKPTLAKSLPLSRAPAIRAEFVLPRAELERFLTSRMYRHLSLLLSPELDIPVVENAVTSDTALHFESPEQKALKLGSLALLRSAWRAKRQAWLAIRMWRKQLTN